MGPDDAIPLHNVLRRDLVTSDIPILNVTRGHELHTLQEALRDGTDGLITDFLDEDQLVDATVLALERSSTEVSESGRRSTEMLHPVAASRSTEKTSPVGSPHNSPDGLVDLMLVEDDEALIPLLLHSFEARGIRAAHTSSGSEAIRLLTGPTPDIVAKVVVLDWNLPGATGLQVLQALATNGVLAGTKVIMLTGRSSEAETLRSLELGASDHVAKPFSIAVLMQRIDSLLAVRETR